MRMKIIFSMLLSTVLVSLSTIPASAQNWTQINADGFDGSHKAVQGLIVFNGELYAGTMKQSACGVWKYDPEVETSADAWTHASHALCVPEGIEWLQIWLLNFETTGIFLFDDVYLWEIPRWRM